MSNHSLKLPAAPNAHLTYCTNVHPGEELSQVLKTLRGPVAQVRALTTSERFGVGLRLASDAAHSLRAPEALEGLKAQLENDQLYVFTLNGFPYGSFHGQRVKEAVYEPDWTAPERLQYTNDLAHTLSALLEDNCHGSISTVPGGFRTLRNNPDAEHRIASQLVAQALSLFELRETTGKLIEVCLEPEPHCLFETTVELADFLEHEVYSTASVRDVAERTGLSRGEAEAFLRRHINLCLDACHLAVEFEAPKAALQNLESRGIRIGKLQVSAGLSCELGEGQDAERLGALEAFSEEVYLHQVVEQSAGGLQRFVDLPDALAARRDATSRATWRIHFHVPVFCDKLGMFDSTQADLIELLRLWRERPFTEHLEVETYTFGVLPPEFQEPDLPKALARELTWTHDNLVRPSGP